MAVGVKAGDRLGDWIIERSLGAGGMGSVFLCHSVLSSEVKAAVKVLTPSNLKDVENRFIQEMKTLAALNHPAIVRVLGGGRDEDRGLLYMAMELVDGEDLDGRLRRGAMSADEARGVFGPVAAALAYAHSQGVAHRDIKPGNIMLRRDGTPVIVDFGIAVVSGATRHTTEGMVPGTLVYMPPEVFQGEIPDGRHTDAYALGVVLWESLSGDVAFSTGPDSSTGQQMAQIMGLKMRADALDPGEAFPGELREACLRTTEPEPEDRLIDMEEVAELIRGDIEVPSPTTASRRRRGRRRRGWLLPTVGLVAVLVLVVGGLVVLGLGGLALAGALLYTQPSTQVARAPVPLDRSLGMAAAALAASDLDEARVHAGHAIDDHPEDPHANLVYGQVLLQEDQGLLARPYLCAAVAGGLGAQVPGHDEGALDCERGPGASMPLTSPLALADLDLSAAVASADALARARRGDAVVEAEDEAAVEDALEEEEAPAPRRSSSRPAPKPSRAPAPAPVLEPAASAPRPAPAPAPEPEPEPVEEDNSYDLGTEGSGVGGGGIGEGGFGYGSGAGASAGSGEKAESSSPDTQVRIAQLVVKGDLDKSIIEAVLKRRLTALETCVTDASLAGEAEVVLRIAADGTVTAVGRRSGDLGLHACLSRQLLRTRFPATDGPSAVMVKLEFRVR